MDFSESVGFIGGGNMAEALLAGFRARGLLPPNRITVSEPRPERREQLARDFGVTVTADNAEAAGRSGTVILAVKPQTLPAALPALASALDPGTLVISIAAGFPLRKLEAALPASPVVRAMPNTPALVGAGATVIAPGARVTEPMTAWARTLFESVGLCLVLPEAHLDAVTGLSGSGPAYVFLLAQSLAEGGVKMGLPPAEALALARQTILGAGKMMVETGRDPAELRAQVTSPGGTTMEGVRALTEDGFPAAAVRAVEAATLKSRKLGEG